MRRALIALALVLCAPGVAQADTVITFDELVPGSVLTNQYAAQQVLFAPATDWGFSAATHCSENGAFANAGDRAWSGSRVAQLASCPNGELTRRGSLFGVLPTFRTFVRMRVGVLQDGPTRPVVTLRAYNYKKQLIAESSVTPAAGKVGTPIQVSAVTPVIAFFALTWGDSLEHSVAIDDLTYDSLPTPPNPQIAIGRAAGALAFRARMGGTVAASVKLVRFNGSTGPVTFSTTGLPGVISSSVFTPNPAGGSAFESTVNLNLTTDATAVEGRVDAIVTANPAGTAGSTMETLALPVDIVPPFRILIGGLDPSGTVALAPCVQRDLTVDLAVEPGFDEPIALTATGGNGVAAALGTGEILPGFGTRSALTLTDPAGMSALSTVVAVRGVSATADRTGLVSVTSRAASISSVTTRAGSNVFTPSSLLAPFLTQAGTAVTLRGEGFCPGSLVQFGGGGRELAPISIAPDGRSLLAEVPFDATSGPINVTAPAVPPATTSTLLAASSPFAVANYRNTQGYSFANFSSSDLAWEDVVDLYGYTETHIEVDACDFLTVGLVSCSLGTSFVPKPSALIYLGQVDDIGSGGNCFGVALSSWRLATGQHSIGDFAPVGARTVFQLDGAAGPSGDLRQYIRLQHMAQSSRETAVARRKWRGFETAGQLIDRVRSVIAQGRPAMVDIWSGDSGHTVLAYRVTDVPGGFDIETYNPNRPYRTATPAMADEDDTPALHDDRFAKSRITIRNGRWAFAEFGWTGSLADIAALDPGDLPERPLLPDRLVDVIMSMSAGDSPELTNLRDAEGKPLRGASRTPLTSGTAKVGAMLVVPVRAGLSATVKGAGAVSFLGAGGRAMLVQGARELEVGAGARSIEASGGGAVRLVSTQDMRGGERVVDATFRGAAGRVGVALSGESLRLSAVRGGTVALRFGAVGRAGAGNLVLPAFRLGAGATVTVAARSWTRPGAVTVTGQGRTLRLQARAAAPTVRLRGLKARMARSRGIGTAILRASVKGRASAISASLAWSVGTKRGNVKLTEAQARSAARGREVRVRLGRIPAGRVKVVLTLAGTNGFLPKLTSARATAR